MAKLTMMIREGLAKEALRHRFSDEVEAYVAERVAFAAEVYNDLYRKSEREKIDALPAGWLPEVNCISAQFGEAGSAYETVLFSGGVYGTFSKFRKKSNERQVEITKRVLSKHTRNAVKVYPNDHRLSVRYRAIKASGKDLGERIDAAQRQIEAALHSVTTLPALLKAWPEIEPFTARYFSLPTKLPAIPVSKLNEIFKLPVKTAA